MFQEFLQDEIQIDFNEPILYGTDTFQTVTFQLVDTCFLVKLADKIRRHAGYLPFGLGYTEYEERDKNGWYNFYIGINNRYGPNVSSVLDFVVVNTESPDNEKMYSVALTENERQIIYRVLDKQCKKVLHKSCTDLLEEAK